MINRPLQIFRIFTLILVGFIGVQIYGIVSIKDSEFSHGDATFLISRQQFLGHKIFYALRTYKEQPSDEKLIKLNAYMSLFKTTQKILIDKLSNPQDFILSGEINDNLVTFINETERLKSNKFEIDANYQRLALDEMPSLYHKLLNGVLAKHHLESDELETKSITLIVSLLLFMLQSFLLVFFERELKI